MITRGQCGRLTPSIPPGEIALLDRCKAGDSDAWNTLIHRYEKLVFKFAYSLCHNHEEANDISGQVFLRLYQSLHTFRYEASFASWLYTVVKHAYVDMFARAARPKPLSLDTFTSDAEPSVEYRLCERAPSPFTRCLEKERAQMLASAILHLPAYQRRVLQMYHIEGKSYDEISEAIGLSVGTVKSRLHRARSLLRERLTPYQDFLMAA